MLDFALKLGPFEALRGSLALPKHLLQVREGLSQLALGAHWVKAVHLVFVPATQEEGRERLDVAEALPVSRSNGLRKPENDRKQVKNAI